MLRRQKPAQLGRDGWAGNSVSLVQTCHHMGVVDRMPIGTHVGIKKRRALKTSWNVVQKRYGRDIFSVNVPGYLKYTYNMVIILQ